MPPTIRGLLNFSKFLGYLKERKLTVFKLEYGPGYAQKSIEDVNGVTQEEFEEVLEENQNYFLRINMRFNTESDDMKHSTEITMEYNIKEKEARLYAYGTSDKKKTVEDVQAEETAAANLEKLLTTNDSKNSSTK